MTPGFGKCLKWIRSSLDQREYARIEKRFAKAKHSKYLDLAWYAKHKFNQMPRFGAHLGAPPRRILDVGCGPGHLGLVARYGGHTVLGLDQPLKEPHLYTVLCQYFGVEKIDHRVEPFQPLPRVGEFDRITATVTKFDLTPPWGVAEWQFFIDDARSLLREGGLVYVTLTTSKHRPREVLDFFKDKARWSNGRRAFLL